jgi:hypothetical protein
MNTREGRKDWRLMVETAFSHKNIYSEYLERFKKDRPNSVEDSIRNEEKRPREEREQIIRAWYDSAPAHLLEETGEEWQDLDEGDYCNGCDDNTMLEENHSGAFDCYEEFSEAEYRGRKVSLGKPFRTPKGPKKFSVYVKDPKTKNIKKVNFGDPNMRIKKNIKSRRKSFRARHNCDNPGPKTKARYWSCRAW